MESYWTVGITLVTLCALSVLGTDLSAQEQSKEKNKTDGNTEKAAVPPSLFAESQEKDEELKALREENKLLRKELFEIIEKYRKQNREYRKVQLSIAASLLEMKKKTISDKDDDLLKSLQAIIEAGRKLAAKNMEFCKYINIVIERIQLSELEKARIKIKLDELKTETGNLSALVSPSKENGRPDKCRIFAVNKELKVVVLSTGYINGVRNGLIWWTGKDRKCKLRVTATRPYVSAAVLLEGDINKLMPGMNVHSGQKKVNDK